MSLRKTIMLSIGVVLLVSVPVVLLIRNAYRNLFPPIPAPDICNASMFASTDDESLEEMPPEISGLELKGHYGGMPADNFLIRGSHMFLKGGLELTLLDLANPTQPARIGYTLMPGELVGLSTNGEIAYVRFGSRLWAVDFSEPKVPNVREILNIVPVILDLHIDDNVIHLAIQACNYKYSDGLISERKKCSFGLYTTSLSAMDIDSDGPQCQPGTEKQVRNRILTLRSTRKEEANIAEGHYAYRLVESEGILVEDISNSSAPTRVGSYNPPGDIRKVILKDQLAYLASGTQIVTLDLSDPAYPTELSRLSFSAYGVSDLVISEENIVIVGFYDGEHTLELIDLSEPSHPVRLGVWSADGDGGSRRAGTPLSEANFAVSDLLLDGDQLFVSTPGAIYLLEISDPASPTLLWTITGNSFTDIHLIDNYLYATWFDGRDDGGFEIFDIKNGCSNISSVHIPERAMAFTILNGIAYVSNWYGKVSVMDVSSPNSPIVLGSFDIGFRADEFWPEGNKLYIAVDDGVVILDVSNPTQPRETGSLATEGTASSIYVDLPNIYYADFVQGLFILQDTSAKETK